MEVIYINRNHDEEIIGLIRSILSNAEFNIETINEAILVKLMALRGTPISYDKTFRDIDTDYKRWRQKSNKAVKPTAE